MDDTYAFPKDCHIMGMGHIVELDAGRAVAENERGRVEILAQDTFKNDSLNLMKIFKLNACVVYKARKCQPNGRLSHVYVANYVKKVEDCFVGEATITELNKTYGHLQSKKHGKIFFNAQSFGDPSCDPYYANIRDCRLFFRQNDIVKYIAVTQGRFSTTLYTLHFELLLNHQTMSVETLKKLENNNDKPGVNLLPNLDLKLLPASKQIRLVGVIIDFDSKDSSCDVWVKRYGFLKLYPDDFDQKLVNMKDLKLLLNIGDRVMFRFVDDEIEDVKLLEQDAKERLSLYLKDLPSVKKSAVQTKKPRKCALSNPDGRHDRYFAFPTPVRPERQRLSPADIIKTISQQSLAAAVVPCSTDMSACVENFDDSSVGPNDGSTINSTDHFSQESESISTPLSLDDEQVFKKEDEEEFMDKLSTYTSPSNKQRENTFAVNDDNFIFNTLFAYKPNNSVMTPIQTSSQPQQAKMISSTATCNLSCNTASLVADPFAINPTQELLSRMNLIQQSNSSKSHFLPVEKISAQIPRMPKMTMAAENKYLRIPSPCPLGMLNYGIPDAPRSGSSSSNTSATLQAPPSIATVGRQRQQTSPPSTDEGCFSLLSNSPPATTADACIQTDPAFERMVIDTLTSHREIFEVIVAKEPELMYKWYTYRMMRPG
uniref:Telomeric single stranded DNA binding POT1/Cdc13 domain-containing protein n=1 Tax=Romanomermis culicivorax TaxID=13658 RepID=A0A915JQ11_ROMCU